METNSPVEFHRTIAFKICKLIIILFVLFLGTWAAFNVIQKYKSNRTQDQDDSISKINISQIIHAPSNKNVSFCVTSSCVDTAIDLLKAIDETIDPCENFYEFTCGSWLKKTTLPGDIHLKSSFTKLADDLNQALVDVLSSSSSKNTIKSKTTENARHFYNVCVSDLSTKKYDTEDIHSAIRDKTGIGSITVPWNLSEELIKLNKHNVFLFFKVQTSLDFDKSKTLRHVIQLAPASKYYLDPMDEFQEFASATLDLSDYFSLFELDVELKPYLLPRHFETILEPTITTVKNLTQLMNTTFDFSSYVRRLYLLVDVVLTDDDIVVVYLIEDIRAIISIIDKQFINTLYRYMSKKFLQSYDSYFSAESNSIQTKCAEYLTRHMALPVGKLYIDKYFDDNAQHEAIEIARNIQETFIDMVQQSKWMDESSKIRTIEKIKHIRNDIGYPNSLKNNNFAYIEAIYAEYQFTSSHFDNVLLIRQYPVRQNLQKLRRAFKPDEYSLFSPVVINAFYNPTNNDITFPAGILQSPMFRKDVPKYLNYGAFGAILGHEITHGFDELRRPLNIDGSQYKLWSKETAEMYKKRSKCMIDQYNNYIVSQINHKINGTLTLNENIADTDGLKKAFYAYQKWKKSHNINEEKIPGLQKYSDEQMFFISFGQFYCSKMSDLYAKVLTGADNHSPHEFRVIGSTSNFVEFDRAFGCKPGQKNSRINKCKVW